jgi:hypothetical protein
MEFGAICVQTMGRLYENMGRYVYVNRLWISRLSRRVGIMPEITVIEKKG